MRLPPGHGGAGRHLLLRADPALQVLQHTTVSVEDAPLFRLQEGSRRTRQLKRDWLDRANTILDIAYSKDQDKAVSTYRADISTQLPLAFGHICRIFQECHFTCNMIR